MAEKKKKTDEELQQDLQRKYLEMQMMAQQIKQIQEQIQNMDTQMAELESTAEALQELSKTKPSIEMFVPVSAGVFAKAELKDTKNMLVNVGAGTAVEKPAIEVKKMIDEQVREIGKYKNQAMQQLERLMEHARKHEEELKKLI